MRRTAACAAAGFTLRFAGLLCGLLAGAAAFAQPGGYADRDDVHEFVRAVAGRDGLDEQVVLRTLGEARYQPDVIRVMEPLPPGRRSWRAYRSRFVTEQRIRNGLQFWQAHRTELARAAAEYGVPAEIIVAIIGVETEYGRSMGTFRILDALATLAFDYPRRAEYFREELEHYLIFARDEGIPAESLRGSYAGAIGIPQFMPGSIRRWAVDFDGDGRRDLIASAADAIGSVAHYLREHGWQAGESAAVRAQVHGDGYRPLLDLGVQPFLSAGELAHYGVSSLAPLAPTTPVALIELDSPDQPSRFWLGLQNFYVITRYNQSSFYAMSVIELAAEMKGRSR